MLPSLIRKLTSYWHWFLAVGVVWLIMAGEVYAQVAQEEEKPKGYIPSYLIIIFAVGGGLTMICRSGKRTTDFRPME